MSESAQQRITIHGANSYCRSDMCPILCKCAERQMTNLASDLLAARERIAGLEKGLNAQHVVGAALVLPLLETPDEKDTHIARLQREKEEAHGRIEQLEKQLKRIAKVVESIPDEPHARLAAVYKLATLQTSASEKR